MSCGWLLELVGLSVLFHFLFVCLLAAGQFGSAAVGIWPQEPPLWDALLQCKLMDFHGHPLQINE